jgi:hypothetical protein
MNSEAMTLEEVLELQISRIADPSNHELHGWWNWHPNATGIPIMMKTREESKYQSKINFVGKREVDNADDFHTPFRCRDHYNEFSEPTLSIQSTPLEIIIADLHDQVIDSCKSYFASLGMPVSLKQNPIQAAILDRLYDCNSFENTCTFVIFGGYGSGECHSGLQKQFEEAFPEQMHDLKVQAVADGFGRTEEMELNMSNQGNVYVASPPVPSPSGPIHLMSCAAYPRGQSPTEQEHIKHMIVRAMQIVRDMTQGSGYQKIIVVTHAVGSFVGHTNPSVFSWGISHGVKDFLSQN